MKKRSFTALVLVLVMMASVFGLAGCGKKSDGGTEKTTKAPVTEAADDEKEQKGSEIVEPKTRIGEYVHYNVNLGIGDAASVDDDWIVFYQDEDAGITYLIAAGLLSTDTCPPLVTAKERGGFNQTVSFNKELNVSYSVTFNNYDPYNEAVIDPAVTARYMHTWTVEKKGDTHKHAFIADLLDQNVWDSFVLKDKDGKKFDDSMLVAGTPTLILWEKSWEASGYSPIDFEIGDVVSDKVSWENQGYIFPKSSDEQKDSIELNTLEKSGYYEDENYNLVVDKVYVQEAADAPDCYGYWLASPAALPNNSNNLLAVFKYGKIDSFCFDNNDCSVRPVISFNTSLIGKDSSSEIYYLGKNING